MDISFLQLPSHISPQCLHCSRRYIYRQSAVYLPRKNDPAAEARGEDQAIIRLDIPVLDII